MSYSIDIRHLVIKYVAGGGSKSEAARRFGVSRGRVYAWVLLGSDLERINKPGPKGSRKVNSALLLKEVKARQDAQLKELAAIFKVHESTISRRLKALNLSRKKNMVVS
jgi:transposase